MRTLAVASAFPDPPFEVTASTSTPGGHDTGFDIELMGALCETLGVAHKVVKFEGHDFNRIFDGLASGAYDAVISGTTVTPERQAVARFTDHYLESGQSLVVNTRRTPTITSVDDLTGEIVGIQVGNTSDAVRRRSRPRVRSRRSSTTRTPASSTRSTTSPPERSARSSSSSP